MSARLPRAAAAAFGVGLCLALAVAGLSGCAAAPPSASPSPSSPPRPTADAAVVIDGIGLAVLQNRPDYATRTLQLAVTNEGAAPVTVVSARFESTQFASTSDWSKHTEVPAGLIRQLPVPLGEAVCPAPDGALARLTVTVAEADGTERTVTAAPADPFGVLERIAGEDCFEESVADTTTLRLDDRLEITGTGREAVARLTLHVEPVDDGAGGAGGAGEPSRSSVTLVAARPTILLDPAEGDDWPLDVTVAAGDQPVAVEIDVVPARCDPHAIAEDKRGTVLPIEVTRSEGDTGTGTGTGTVHVVPSDTLRVALYDFIASSCGFAVEDAG
ncbi:hypothetical protein [Herbiconiux liukaitaii]|uniref:hypothetical protein n=1 Tax=Herbiconiux liukaitaii TaxID=3342799 RepID=UPI0035B71B5D